MPEQSVDRTFDYIVVGGGSAGCVLANRLSADPAYSVCLIEAGPDTPPEAMPPSLYRDAFLPDYFQTDRYWTKLEAYYDPIGNRSINALTKEVKPKRYEQARVMGGGSTVNGQVMVRGLPRDYDEWAEAGAEGWSYEECLPYFRRAERDLDFASPLHGGDGPIPVRRTFPEHWSEYALSFRELLAANGIAYLEDSHLQDGQDACFPFARNNIYDHRVSAASAYLTGAVRRRPNLTILAGTEVERILFDGRRAVGVVAGGQRLKAGEVILSAGALHSPALLMRAGIGAGEHLAEHGIAVLADRRGVGENLRDHPMVGFGLALTDRGRADDRIKNSFLIHTRWSSDVADCATQDMKLSISCRFSATSLGKRLAAVNFGPNKAYSRGVVRLASASHRDEPVVAFNYLSDPRDIARFRIAVPKIASFLRSAELSPYVHAFWPGVFADSLRKLQEPSPWTTVKTEAAARLLDLGGPFRKILLDAAIDRRFTMDKVLADERVLEDWIRYGMKGDWHACGTCRMGRDDDPLAVTDREGRVLGVDGLRVVDASVMPTIPSANINASVYMIAEKMAEAVIGRR